MEPLHYYGRYKPSGWLALIVMFILAWLVFDLRWYLAVFGAATGILVISAAFKAMNSLWPHPPVLVPHTLRTYPDNLPPLAEFLDQIAGAAEWSPEFDKQLDAVKRQKTYDDWLENVAIEFAELYKDRLQGGPPQKRRGIKQDFRLEELRAELRAIAGDVRIAGKS
jgi:hypothetical protein